MEKLHTNDNNSNGRVGESATEAATGAEEESPVIDIVINNVVCTFSVRCHLNLKKIAMEGMNVEYKKEQGMVSMKLRRPYTTASIWSSGKITCTGATSEDEAKVAARRYARCLQNLGFPVKFSNFRVVNVLGTCTMPFPIRVITFSRENSKQASYEPELHPGVTYRIVSPKATLKIFSTGSITITAPQVANVQSAVEHIFPLVYQHRMSKDELSTLPQTEVRAAQRMTHKTAYKSGKIDKRPHFHNYGDDAFSSDSEDEDEDFDSDTSQD